MRTQTGLATSPHALLSTLDRVRCAFRVPNSGTRIERRAGFTPDRRRRPLLSAGAQTLRPPCQDPRWQRAVALQAPHSLRLGLVECAHGLCHLRLEPLTLDRVGLEPVGESRVYEHSAPVKLHCELLSGRPRLKRLIEAHHARVGLRSPAVRLLRERTKCSRVHACAAGRHCDRCLQGTMRIRAPMRASARTLPQASLCAHLTQGPGSPQQ